MGPLLKEEFTRQLDGLVATPDTVIKDTNSERNLEPETQNEEPALAPAQNDLTPGDSDSKSRPRAQVGLISHVGGHKWAGNVIIYIPPSWRFNSPDTSGEEISLAGCGIWYGRMEPKHVEGIIKETILGGKIVRDLFRGGVNQDGEVLRIPLEPGKAKKPSDGTKKPNPSEGDGKTQAVNDLSASAGLMKPDQIRNVVRTNKANNFPTVKEAKPRKASSGRTRLGQVHDVG